MKSKPLPNVTTSAKAGPKAAMPLTFAGTVGLFMPAATKPSATAVLLLSPWGFEEMCTRKFWRILAEDLAEAGMASLRFDYVGTGDALDMEKCGAGLAAWQETAIAAADRLRLLSGCDNILLVSQGLGATVAISVAARLKDMAGIAFLAPVTSGRLYLRELAVWSKMIDESLGVGEKARAAGGVSVAGLVMPDAVVADVRRIDLMASESLPSQNCLVLARRNRPPDAAFARHLGTLGGKVREEVYEGYDGLVSNPTIAEMPLETGAKIVDWARSIAGLHPAAVTTKQSPAPATAPLRGDGFCETPIRFGGGRLFGILCEPDGPVAGATALLLTTAYDRSAGWARSSVIMARRLARHGIPSLRFDTANVADSPPTAGAPQQVLYAESQFDDVSAAFQFLEDRELLPAFVVGRCSGGYLAFQSALNDVRCGAVVTANPAAFHWDPRQSVDAALRDVPRSLATYGQKLLQRKTLQRMLTGRIDILSAGRNLATSLTGRLWRLRRPLLDLFPFLSREHAAIVSGFKALGDRDVEISLLYSSEDIGLEHARQHLGSERARTRAFPHTRLTVIADADHNMTPPHAQDIYFKEVRRMALELCNEGRSAQKIHAEGSVKSRRYAHCRAS